MPDAAALEVNVRRPDGTPAAGVAVELEHPDPLPSSTGETDAHGSFRFERVPPGPFRWIAQESTGAAPLSIVHDGNLRPGESFALDAMTLSPAWTIRGTATCGSRALSNWTVSLIDNTDTLSPWQNRTTNTAVDGRFAFAGCVGTDYTLRLRPAGRSSGIAHASVAGVAPGASEIRLSFEERSESSAFVRGTLPEIEIAAGHAVIVTAFRAGNPASTDGAAETLVDRGSRRFEIGPLPPGEFELHATHSSLGRWKIADVAVHPGAEIDLGRVSAPRSGTLLVRWSQSWGSIDENFSLVIDGQGVQIGGRRDHSAARFEVDEAARTIRIPGLLAGRYSVLVQGQRIASELRSVHIAPDEESKVDVALRQGTPVEVRLKSPRLLTARESVAVKIHAQEETLEFTVFERPRVFDLDAVAQFRSVLALGSHRIEVVTSGGLRGERTIHIRDSEPVGVVTLELR
jgi:hypothetical protein